MLTTTSDDDAGSGARPGRASAAAGAWAADFTYEYYSRILRLIKSKFQLCRVAEAEHALKSKKSSILVRHDVDVSLTHAFAMARLEHDAGVRSTYFIIPNGRLYSITDPESRSTLACIQELGHEIGLHFDLPQDGRNADQNISEVLQKIEHDCAAVELACGRRVESISFHRPTPSFLRGPMQVVGRTNAYAAELMSGFYLSDSRGMWRQGEPIMQLEQCNSQVVQLLTHPIWWGIEHKSASDRLQEFFDVATRGKSDEQVAEFDRWMVETVPGVLRTHIPVGGQHT